MKHFALFSLLLLGSAAIAQSSKRDPLYQIDYETKLAKSGSAIAISTYKSDSEQDKTLVLSTSSQVCPASKGVRIRLVNGDNLFYDDVAVECTAYAPDRPNVTARLLLTPELEQQLDGQEIAEFSLGQLRTPVAFKDPNDSLKMLFKLVKDEMGF